MSASLSGLRSRLAALSPEQRELLAERLRMSTESGHAAAGGTRLVAYIVPADGRHGAPDPGELRSFLRDRLPEHMIPTAFVPLEELPRLPNGKVDPHALPEPEPVWGELQASYLPPRNPTEQALAEIWAEVLGIDRIGVHDNFFEIGGHSLLAVQLLARVRRSFELTLPVSTVFEVPSVALMAERIDTLRWARQELRPQEDPGEEREEISL